MPVLNDIENIVEIKQNHVLMMSKFSFNKLKVHVQCTTDAWTGNSMSENVILQYSKNKSGTFAIKQTIIVQYNLC